MKLWHVPEPSALPDYVRESDLRGCIVAPALTNAHDHLHLNRVPPLAHHAPFANSYAWIDAFAPHFDAPEVKTALAVPKAARMWHGALKNALAGATTVMHHDPWHAAFDALAFPVRVLQHYGWCHSLRLSQSGQYGPTPVESWRDTPEGAPWFIHLAEGTDDAAHREFRELDALGCVHENTVLIHGVGLTNRDIDVMIERRARLVWCPSSNIGMLGATVPAAHVRRLFDAGLLALGTDSRLTGSRDLLDELRVAQAWSDLTPEELANLVFAANRTALGLDGAHVDFIVFQEQGDPSQTLLRQKRGDLRAVIRNSKPIVADADLGEWFRACGVDAAEVRLDGRDKLIAKAALSGLGDAGEDGLIVPALEARTA